MMIGDSGMRPLSLLLALAFIGSGPAPVAVIEVFPGAGTPLQDALDAAEDGDTVHVNEGTYNEAVIVDKDRVRLVGEGAFIDAGCAADTALEVAADRVRVEGVIVLGATVHAVDIENLEGVTVRNVGTRETCGGVARYRINVFQSRRMTVARSSGEDCAFARVGKGTAIE
jgi:pectin methylesterase-like acyl-CoA thioesterase